MTIAGAYLSVQLRPGHRESIQVGHAFRRVLDHLLLVRRSHLPARLVDLSRRLQAVYPFTQTLAAVRLTDILDIGRPRFINPHKLLPHILLRVYPGNVSSGKDLPRSLYGPGKAVPRPRRHHG